MNANNKNSLCTFFSETPYIKNVESGTPVLQPLNYKKKGSSRAKVFCLNLCNRTFIAKSIMILSFDSFLNCGGIFIFG